MNGVNLTMKCKNCGAQIKDGVEICPICKQKVQKLSTGVVLAISMAAVLVVAVILAAVLLLGKDNDVPDPGDVSNPGGTTASGEQITQPDADPNGGSNVPAERPEGSFTVDAATVTDAKLQQVVATNGDAALTNEMLSYYYWFGYSNFINYYGEYVMQYLDVSKPLDSQYYDNGETTWQAYFLELALNDFQYYSSMCAEAQAANYTLDDVSQASLDGIEESLAGYAQQFGYETGEDYLRACFGAKATVKGYKEFMRQYLTGMNYATYLRYNLSFSEEDVAAFYEENKDAYIEAGILQDGTCLATVRHILIAPSDTENPADWIDAEQTAADIYENWQNNPTEEFFAQLAGTYSADSGSSANGGQYENIFPGEMVETFDAWCFDPARQPGDHGIVESEFGYHIMYFCSRGTEFWVFAAGADLINQAYGELETSIIEKNRLAIEFDKIILVDPIGMYE